MANAFDAVEEVLLQSISDVRGDLCVADGANHIPFPIRRVFYIYDVPDGAERGGHAHLTCRRALIAARGSLSVTLSDGHERRTYELRHPNRALIVPPRLWEELRNFSSDALLLVLADEPYSEADYVRDYSEFLRTMSASQR